MAEARTPGGRSAAPERYEVTCPPLHNNVGLLLNWCFRLADIQYMCEKNCAIGMRKKKRVQQAQVETKWQFLYRRYWIARLTHNRWAGGRD